MNLPGMTEDIAAAMLNWVDEDEAPRQFGAEADYYRGLDTPYAPRNSRPESLEELLLVRGVTRALLFGLDANRDYLVDPEEARGGGLAPDADAGGGWASLLTVSSTNATSTILAGAASISTPATWRRCIGS